MKKIRNSKKFGISILGILAMLFLAFLILIPKSNADDNAIVYFECKNLKATLNEQLGKSPDSDITIGEMRRLDWKLTLSSKNISSMKGLEYLRGIFMLWLNDNKIRKIEDLAWLPSKPNLGSSLGFLNLQNNQIGKIENLDKLTNLKTLNLNGNQISKIEGLYNLTDLEQLNLYNNQITKIEGLDKLINLKNLDLGSQRINLIIKSNEFELPKIMNKNEEIEVTIVDEFKNNITKIGENKYRIDDEGRKKLKEKQVIFEWNKKIKVNNAYDEENQDGIIFSGTISITSELKQNELFEPKIDKNRKVKAGEKLDITTLLLNKPNDSSVEVVEDINTNSLGKKKGKIKVKFSDGSFKEIEVEVIVNTFDVQINYLDKKDKLVKSEVKKVKIDPKKLR